MIFVNSMSDLFHKEVPKEFLARVFDTMERAHWAHLSGAHQTFVADA
jgi:protein gp37